MLGMPDYWTPVQFDLAVSYLGRYVENKLAETDDKGRHINSLLDVIGTYEDKQNATLESLRAMFGGGGDNGIVYERK